MIELGAGCGPSSALALQIVPTALDPDHATGQIHVGPPKRPRLPAPEPRVQRRRPERPLAGRQRPGSFAASTRSACRCCPRSARGNFLLRLRGRRTWLERAARP